MTERLDELGEWSVEEERARVAVWALAKAVTATRAASEECMAPGALAAFAAGGPAAAQSRQILAHLAACARCRALEDALRRQGEPRPALAFHLPTLRRAAQADRSRVASLLADVQAWLAGMLERGPAPLDPALECELAATGLRPPRAAWFALAAPVAVDRRGRLSVELSTAARVEQSAVVVAIQDSEYRLELCAVPVKGGQVRAIVDCEFLGLPEGALSATLIRLALIPAEEAGRWGAPPMMGALRALAEWPLEAAEVFDGVSAILAAQGERWQRLLRAEVGALPDPAAGVAVIETVLQQLELYATAWQESNQTEHPAVGEYIAGLSEVGQGTQPPARAKPAPGEATAGLGRAKKTRKSLGV